MSLISKIQSLISSANLVTGESRTDLTSAVQDLKDGYGGSTVEKGLVFSEYDSDGYPHKAELKGNWTSIPATMFFHYFGNQTAGRTGTETTYGKYISQFVIPDGVTEIGDSGLAGNSAFESVTFPNNDITLRGNACRYWDKIQSIYFPKNVTLISNSYRNFSGLVALKSFVVGGNINIIAPSTFENDTQIELFDFSHCTAIPPLHSVDSIAYKSGCVIKIPLALSDQTLGTGNGWESQTNWSGLTNIVWEAV